MIELRILITFRIFRWQMARPVNHACGAASHSFGRTSMTRFSTSNGVADFFDNMCLWIRSTWVSTVKGWNSTLHSWPLAVLGLTVLDFLTLSESEVLWPSKLSSNCWAHFWEICLYFDRGLHLEICLRRYWPHWLRYSLWLKAANKPRWRFC